MNETKQAPTWHKVSKAPKPRRQSGLKIRPMPNNPNVGFLKSTRPTATLFALYGASLAITGTFIPWTNGKYFEQAVNGLNLQKYYIHGMLPLVLSALTLLLAIIMLTPLRTRFLHSAKFVYLIAGFISFLLINAFIIRIIADFNTGSKDGPTISDLLSRGVYLTLTGTLFIIIAGTLTRRKFFFQRVGE